jgi:Zn-dependent peptidase ImmA (M78 family)
MDREEIAANAFAAELLMPDKFVRTEIVRLFNKKSVLDREDLINKLAGTFKVSVQAMEYRLNNLGILTTQ